MWQNVEIGINGRISDTSHSGTHTRWRRLPAAIAVALVVGLTSFAGASAARAPAGPPLNPCWAAYVAPAPPHGDPPTVDAVSVSPGSVDVSDGPATLTVTLRAHAGSPSELRSAWAILAQLDALTGSRLPVARVDLVRQDDDTWAGTVEVPRGARGDWVLDSAGVTDDAGQRGTQSFAVDDPDPGHRVTVTSPPDDVPPALASLRIGPDRVDTTRHGRVVTLTARVSDAYSGVAQVSVLRANSDNQFPTVLLPTGTPDEYTGRLRIPRWVGDKPWRFALLARDAAGNAARRGPGSLGAPSESTVQVRSGPPDTNAPRVRDVRATPNPLDVREGERNLHLRVRATDDRSGVGKVVVRLPMPGGPIGSRLARLVRTSGTARDGIWTGTIHVPECADGSGPHLLDLSVRDRAPFTYRGNLRRGPDSSIRLRAHDNRQPAVTSIPDVVLSTEQIELGFSEPVSGISTDHVQLRTGDAVLAGSWTCAGSGGNPVDCLAGPAATATFTADAEMPRGQYRIDFAPDRRFEVRDAAGNPMTQTYQIEVIRNSRLIRYRRTGTPAT